MNGGLGPGTGRAVHAKGSEEWFKVVNDVVVLLVKGCIRPLAWVRGVSPNGALR